MAGKVPTLRRALLYGMTFPLSTPMRGKRTHKSSTVPGSSLKMLEKTRGLTADCVAYDLEDSVTVGKKAEARANIHHFLEQEPPSGIKDCAVRINSVGSGLEADDLSEVVRSPTFQFNCLLLIFTVHCPSPSHNRHSKGEFCFRPSMG